ncbi:MAG TPA: rRNA maturation RNase YbeY [Candidatus Gallibacteroides avistercoris]|uniref:Endoribonuclease YbeY n=1 Tax=Candidatus Gallibacteroides avistercoris TaxID=2840833 RepID=A0A9D1M885_9BACT|nr:rRNA maturation RNase YbeY [Candidatus Gallibacteroides avistercoris]
MAIHYFAEETQVPAIKKREISRWIKAVAATYGKTTGEISYIFCNDSRILEVNRQYLQHDYYTDIITFDYTEGNRISGDIFISLDTVKSNAQEYGQRFEDELHRIIIHGILHLCGIKDKGEKERQQMTRCENQALEQLSVMQAEAQKENP